MYGKTINSIIQKTLNKRKEVYGRSNPDKDPYNPSTKNRVKDLQQYVVKTPYITMISSPELLSQDGTVVNEKFQGEVILGNKEYSERDLKESLRDGLYSTKDGRRFIPSAGIKSLSSEYLSSSTTNFTRKVTVTWNAYSLEDIEILTERFMSLQKLVYLEWGWLTKGHKPFYNSSTIEKYKDPTELRKKVMEVGKGNFDALIGVVENFSWSTSEGGTFQCTSDISVLGVDILNQKLDSDKKVEPVKKPFEDMTIKEQNQQTSLDYSAGYENKLNFQTVIANLSEFLGDIVKNKEYKTGRRVKTGEVDSSNEFLGDQDVYEDEIIKVDFNQEKLESETTSESNVQNSSTTTKNKTIYYNNNFVITQTRKIKRTTSAKVMQKTGIQASNISNILSTSKKESWVRWGWFEDNILNKFFGFVNKEGNVLSQIRSILPVDGFDPKNPTFEPVYIKNGENFTTLNMNTFIFPGQLRIKKEDKLLNVKNNQFYTNLVQSNPERNYANYSSIPDGVVELSNGEYVIEPGATEEELQKIYKNKTKLQVDGLEQIPAYLYQLKLEKIFSQLPPFAKEIEVDGKKTTDKNLGSLRNIFINLEHIENIFSSGIDTLGEALDELCKSLNGSVKLWDLQTVANTEISDTFWTIQDIKTNKDESDKLNNEEFYKFPINTKDSFVLSQNLQTDLSAENAQIIQGAILQQINVVDDVATSPGKDIDNKTKASPSAHAIFFSYNPDNTTPFLDEIRKIKMRIPGLTPALSRDWYSYGNFSGSPNEKLRKNGGVQFLDMGLRRTNTGETKKYKDTKAKEDKQKRKDALTKERFSISQIGNYTAEGFLNQEIESDMLNGVNFKWIKTPDGLKPSFTQDEYSFIFLTNEIEIPGIAGIFPSNTWTTDYLPSTRFKNDKFNPHFFTENVSQTCDSTGWKTTLTGRLMFRWNTIYEE